MVRCAIVIGFFYSFVCEAQSVELPLPILRSAFGVTSFQQDTPQLYIVQQSLGQSGVIGDYSSGDFVVSQGFVQSSLLPVRRHKKAKTQHSLEVYPNPFDNELSLAISKMSEGPIQIAVYNGMGCLIESYEYQPIQHLSIRLGHLPPGNYILRLHINDESIHKQIIKLT